MYRYMSSAEAQAVRTTGVLRGGRAGDTYLTTQATTSSSQAASQLALPVAPEVRMTVRVLNNPNMVRYGTRVQSAPGRDGGGVEYMTRDRVNVEILEEIILGQ
jgi:hypothetical protein